MPPAGFFQKLGFFVVPDFLEPEYLAQLRKEIATAPAEKGTVTDPYSEALYVKPDIRRVDSCLPSRDFRVPLKRRLEEIQPVLERHFGTPLGGYEQPQYLVYHPGDFFKPH